MSSMSATPIDVKKAQSECECQALISTTHTPASTLGRISGTQPQAHSSSTFHTKGPPATVGFNSSGRPPLPGVGFNAGMGGCGGDYVTGRTRTEPAHTDLHDYLEVDVLWRIRSLQTEIDGLRASLLPSDTSTKSKDSSIYEHIGSKTTSKTDDLCGLLSQGAKSRGFFYLSRLCESNVGVGCRLLWALILISSLAMTGYQISDRVRYYISTPHHVNIKTWMLGELAFPAVTICNLNKFRLTEAADKGMYDTLYAVQHNKDRFRNTGVSTSQASTQYTPPSMNVTYEDFMRTIGHQKDNLVYRCQWQDQDCGPINFTETFTNYGLCYTFKPNKNNRLVYSAGPQFGLLLMLNVEQYEYILGPTSAVGVKVAIHDPEVTPAHFTHIPVGKLTSMEIKKIKYQPFRFASSLLSSRSDSGICRVDCQSRCTRWDIRWMCNCAIPPYDEHDDVRKCVVQDYIGCITKVFDGEGKQCNCAHKCAESRYDISMSYAAIPKYGMESEVRKLRHRSQLEKQFRKAIDIYHKVDSVMVRYDKDTLRKLRVDLELCSVAADAFHGFLNNHTDAYRRKKHDLQGMINKLNNPVLRHYLYFKQHSHTSFTSFLNILRVNLNDILQKERLALSQGIRGSNETLTEIVWSLKHLVDTRDPQVNVVPLLLEIQEKIAEFRRDIVLGYGQQYREFRAKKDFYDNVTQQMFNITDSINNRLLDDNAALKQITMRTNQFISGHPPRESSAYERRWLEKLKHIFRDVKNLLDREMESLDKKLDLVLSNYHRDREKVLAVLERFNESKVHFTRLMVALNSSMQDIKRPVVRLSERLESLKTYLIQVTDGYIGNHFGKIELGVKFENDFISKENVLIQSLVREARSAVEGMTREATNLASALESTRLINFASRERQKTDSIMDWLKSLPLETEVGVLLESVEQTMTALVTYQKELTSYAQTRKINEAFYRNNFLHLNIHYKEIAEVIHQEEVSYSLLDLICDIGCTLALYMGASLLTIFQLFDFLRGCSKYATNKAE